MFFYLTKPFRREMLQAVLRNALTHHAACRALEESIRKADAAAAHLDACRAWRDEIDRRLGQPPFRARVAQVALDRVPDGLVLTVRDQGAGFDWRRYLTFDPARAQDSHGRGIAMSRVLSFDSVDYVEPGNCVVAFRRVAR